MIETIEAIDSVITDFGFIDTKEIQRAGTMQ